MNPKVSHALLGLMLSTSIALNAQWNPNSSGTGIYYAGGKVGIGTQNLTSELNVYNPGNWTSIIIGNPNTGSGGYTSGQLGTSGDTNGSFFIQAIKASGSSYGDLRLNPWGGKVGIGTDAPADQTEIVTGLRKVGFNGTLSGASPGGLLSLSRPDDGAKVFFMGTSSDDDHVFYGMGGGSEMRFISGGLTSSGFGFYTNMSAATAFGARPTPIMKITGDGKVGIGTLNPDAKFAVNGTIHATEVKVTATVPGPDYVFEKSYTLPTLEQVKSYIEENRHLPEVPSAKEMEEKGINVGEMNMLLLKKIEELTLYVMELKEENERQDRILKSLLNK